MTGPSRLTLLLLLLAGSAPTIRAEEVGNETPCENLSKKKKPEPEIIKALAAHQEWLADISTGERLDLSGKELENVRIDKAFYSLRRARLIGVHACGANFADNNLSEARLTNSDLRFAYFADANLAGANLLGADLRGADLSRADLTGADLRWTNLQGAIFGRTNLALADLRGANLAGALFEPHLLPEPQMIAEALSLSELRFDVPVALHRLREAFKNAGLRQQEREVTLAINRVPDFDGPENIARYVFFELTCSWGLKPFRPLWVLVLFFLVFTVVYAGATLWWRGGGIYRHREEGAPPVPGSPAEQFDGGYIHATFPRIPLTSVFFFSLLSTFYFGWEELRFDHWLARFNPKDYRLKASGWLRPVSAAQSLISLYLFVLFFLTYFGRPFE